jgi:hypothetical protein
MFKRKNTKPEDLPLLHYTAFRPYIYTYLKSGVKVKSSCPEAMTEYTFLSLSTDLYDELQRRQTKYKRKPSLAKVASYSTRRNTAREKLSSLSEEGFKCFVSDMTKQLVGQYSYVVEMYNIENGQDDYIPLTVEVTNGPRVVREHSQDRGYEGYCPSPPASTSKELPHPQLTAHSPPLPQVLINTPRIAREQSQDRGYYPSPPAPTSQELPFTAHSSPLSDALEITSSRFQTNNTPTISTISRESGIEFEAKMEMQDIMAMLNWDGKSADTVKLQELQREVEVMRKDKWELQEIVERSKVEMETLRSENGDMHETQTALKADALDCQEVIARLKREAKERKSEVKTLRQMKHKFEEIKEEKHEKQKALREQLIVLANENEMLNVKLTKSQNVSLCVFNTFRILGEKTKSLISPVHQSQSKNQKNLSWIKTTYPLS